MKVTYILIGLFFLLQSCGQKDQADLIIYNATIYSADSSNTFHSAMVIDEGIIIDIGSEDLLESYNAHKIINLKRKLVVPGFIDSHVHFMTGGRNLSSVQLRDVKTPEEFIQTIGSFANSLKPGIWIRGGDWDHEQWGGELPKREWIDSVTRQNPVWINRLDGHMALANRQALEKAGITKEIKNPEGGEIVRDGKIPTGIFKDNAMGLIARVLPDYSDSEKRTHLINAMDYVNSHGVTSIHDMGSWGNLETYRSALEDSILTVRIYANLPLVSYNELDIEIKKSGKGNNYLKIGGLKGFVDGSLGSHTAAFFDDYIDAPGEKGFFVIPYKELKKRVIAADALDLQLMVHAIGDSAIHQLLNIYEETIEINGQKDRRFRIEHTQHVSPQDLPRFKELQVIPSMQPYHAIDDGRWAEKVIDKQRAQYTYAFKSLWDAGATIAFGSDWFVAPPIPLMGIYAAVTRQTLDGKNPEGWIPEQKITIQQAVRAYTIQAAYAAFDEKMRGSLEKGKYGDFVILSENIFEIQAEEIRKTHVLNTYLNGREVFSEN